MVFLKLVANISKLGWCFCINILISSYSWKIKILATLGSDSPRAVISWS